MKNNRPDPASLYRLSGIVLILLLLAACSPAQTAAPVTQPPTSQLEPTQTASPLPPAPTETLESAATESAVPVAATSRGPDLEATDPATVSLASGSLQLVEFFRFT